MIHFRNNDQVNILFFSFVDGKAAFQIFLKSEFCEENIEFWLTCEEFRKIKSPAKLSLRAKSIYEEFIKNESPKEVNIILLINNLISL